MDSTFSTFVPTGSDSVPTMLPPIRTLGIAPLPAKYYLAQSASPSKPSEVTSEFPQALLPPPPYHGQFSTKSPHHCSQCLKSFSRRESLSRHLRTVHCAEKSFQCDLCGRKFVVEDSVKRHQQNAHGIARFSCAKCGEKFTRKDQLTKHCCKEK